MNGIDSRWGFATVLSVGFLATMPAAAGAVLTFSDLKNDVTNFPFGKTLEIYTDPTNSFRLTNSSNNAIAFIAWAQNDKFNADQGGATLTTNFPGTTTILTAVGGGGFTFDSIALADWQNDNGNAAQPQIVKFVFKFEDTSIVDETLTRTTDAAPGLETFSFALGKKVTQVTWRPEDINSSLQQIQFDNITLDGGVPPTGVPEPTSLALVALGLGGLGFVRRRAAKT